MKKLAIVLMGGLMMTACIAPKELRFSVAPLGEEVPETTGQYLYVLPKTVLKVEVSCEEMRHVPGPFWEFAEKYLGIREVIRQNFSSWQILDVQVEPHVEMDPEMVFHVNVLEGEFAPSLLDPYLNQGLFYMLSGLVQEGTRSPSLGVSVGREYMRYLDLGIESNFEHRTETMYKTLVTDTSFVRVPVDRTITEQKSPAVKAEEAAEFILELRTRRFELLTGEYEGYPQGEAMEATLAKLDELEASYLSLFNGKTLRRTLKQEWFLVPESGTQGSSYRLATFSEELGFVPEEMQEGVPLSVRIEPLGGTRELGAYYADRSGLDGENRLWYRIPEVVDLSVRLGEETLARQRISLYQNGALVSAPLR